MSLQFVETLEGGAYGSLYSIKSNGTRQIIKRNDLRSNTDFSVFLIELDILNKFIDNPFIVQLEDVHFDSPLTEIKNKPNSDNLYLRLEAAIYDGHDLIYSGSRSGARSSYNYMKQSMIDLLLGVYSLHINDILHLDLKPSNLLWFRQEDEFSARKLKICDFGLSYYETMQEEKHTSVVMTSTYRPPEIMIGMRYDYKADMWSVGCILYEMIKRSSFISYKDQINIEDILTRIKYDDYNIYDRDFSNTEISDMTIEQLLNLSTEEITKFNKSDGTYDQFIELLTGLLSFNPEKRLSVVDALESDFFNNYRDYIDYYMDKIKMPISDQFNRIVTIKGTDPRRLTGIDIFVHFYNKRCYHSRVLFHAVDIFDRYLEYLDDNPQLIVDDTEIELRSISCLYLSAKLFMNESAGRIFDILAKHMRTNEIYSSLAEFERVLVSEILKYELYRPTIYETIPKLDKILYEFNTGRIFQEYCFSDDYENITLMELTDIYLSKLQLSVDEANGLFYPEVINEYPNSIKRTERKVNHRTVIGTETVRGLKSRKNETREKKRLEELSDKRELDSKVKSSDDEIVNKNIQIRQRFRSKGNLIRRNGNRKSRFKLDETATSSNSFDPSSLELPILSPKQMILPRKIKR